MDTNYFQKEDAEFGEVLLQSSVVALEAKCLKKIIVQRVVVKPEGHRSPVTTEGPQFWECIRPSKDQGQCGKRLIAIDFGRESQQHPPKLMLRKCVRFLRVVNSDLGETDHLGREQMALGNPGRDRITC